MKALLKNRQIIAQDTLMATFQLEKPVNFLPGQFALISLISAPYKDAKGPERYFSIVNPPAKNNEISIATRLRDTAFKKSLAQMPIDAPIEVKMIGGSFTFPENEERPIIFITGGIGITPFMSMLRHANENNLPNRITLFYFNRNQQSAVFIEELKQLKEENENFNLILIMTEDNNWQGEKEIVSPELIKKYLSEFVNNVYMIAGPPQMVQEVVGVLTDMGIVSENIITENFAGY